MVWNKNKPYGSDNISQGDDVLRELKSDLENAFKTEFGSDWDGTINKSVHNLVDIPDLSLPNQIKLRQYLNSGLFTLDIFLNNNWIKGTQVFDFPLNGSIITYSPQSFFGWQTVELDRRYLLIVGDNVTSGYGVDPVSTIVHTHYDYMMVSSWYTHNISTSCENGSNTDERLKVGGDHKFIKREHKHNIVVDVSSYIQTHEHTLSNFSFSLNIHFGKIIKKTV